MGEVYRAEDADLARTSRSSCSPATTPTTTPSAAASPARRARSPGSRTRRARSRSSTSASIAAGPTSSWSTFPAARRPARARGRSRSGARSSGSARPPPRSTPRTRTASSTATSSREPPPRRRRPRQGRGLRRRERRRPRLLHRGGHRDRHRRLPRAGAGPRRGGDAGQRPLRARRGRVRAADGEAAVRARVVDRRGDGPRQRPDPACIRGESGAAAGSTTCSRAGSRRSPSTASRPRRLRPRARDALDRAPGTTHVGALARPAQSERRRRPLPLLLLLGGARSPACSRRRCSPAATTRTGAVAPTTPRTVKETVTLPGTTVVETVTTAPAPTTAPTPLRRGAGPANGSPTELNDRGYELMRAAATRRRCRRSSRRSRAARRQRRARRGVRELQPRLHAAGARAVRRRRRPAQPLRAGAGGTQGDQQAAERGRAGCG